MVGRAWMCLWPGLASLWLHGAVGGLALAVIFCGLLNLAVVLTFVWTEAVASPVRDILWLAILAIWVGSAAISMRTIRKAKNATADPRCERWFTEAQTEYLRGNWVEAELKLLKALRWNDRDLEARLLLATLYRHTARFQEAQRELRHLERFQGAVQWQWEIREERRLLAQRSRQDGGTPTSEGELSEKVEKQADNPPALQAAAT
jgi:hypothetical protein